MKQLDPSEGGCYVSLTCEKDQQRPAGGKAQDGVSVL